jgi:hypothetical protein
MTPEHVSALEIYKRGLISGHAVRCCQLVIRVDFRLCARPPSDCGVTTGRHTDACAKTRAG